MRLTYKGRPQEFSPNEQAKLDAKLTRIAKMLERGQERDARVIVTQERHLYHVEITLNAFDHAMVGIGSDREVYPAMTEAMEKLEKQVVRMRTKWRTTKRHKEAPQRTPEKAVAAPAEVKAEARAAKAAAKVSAKGRAVAAKGRAGRVEVHRVNHHGTRKPMTLDEAMLEIEDRDNYLVYRDARTDRMSVLLRRADGHFDLVESE